MEQTIKFIVEARKWFDSKNGNTYHAVLITRTSDHRQIHSLMTYGYGTHYQRTALELLLKAKWIEANEQELHLYERVNNYPIYWIVTEGTKKAMMEITND